MLHEIIDDVKEGDVVLFDDGMIKSLVLSKKEDDVEVVITDCYKPRLSSHKGINLPNTTLNLPALTERDIELLPFICEHSDIIGYSFVRKREDVKQLYRELDKINANEIGVVFKIENQEAFENLPEILLEGMGRNKIGVMIARGIWQQRLGLKGFPRFKTKYSGFVRLHIYLSFGQPKCLKTSQKQVSRQGPR